MKVLPSGINPGFHFIPSRLLFFAAFLVNDKPKKEFAVFGKTIAGMARSYGVFTLA